MRKKLALALTISFIAILLAGCGNSDDRAIRDTVKKFITAKANLDYRNMSGVEGIDLVTEKGKKKIRDGAKLQVAAYRDYKGVSKLVSISNLKITSRKQNDAQVTAQFNLNTISEVKPKTNGTKRFNFTAALKKSGQNWLIDTWTFDPR